MWSAVAAAHRQGGGAWWHAPGTGFQQEGNAKHMCISNNKQIHASQAGFKDAATISTFSTEQATMINPSLST
jgi:hypothetical protein